MEIFGISPIPHFWINIMSLTLQLDAIDTLCRTPASDVKKLGWRGVVEAMQREGKVLVTNHDAPEAVILSPQEYESIKLALELAAARTEPSLDALRDKFDARLAALQASAPRRRSVTEPTVGAGM